MIDNETLIPYSDDYPDVMKDSFGHIWEIRVCQADTCHYYDDDSTLQGYAPTGTKGPASFIFQGTPEPVLICAMCHDGDWIEKDGVSYELHTETGAHEMNDTTRDELIERIAELADQFACGAAGEPVVYALHGPMDFAEEVIALVTAARDAEIREALESEELVGMFARMLWAQGDKPTAAPSSSYYMAARYNLDGIAKHIGLGDETGGQG